MIDKAVDKNEDIEILKNKKRKIIKINHSEVATEFMNFDFIVKKDNVLNLYRPKID